MPSGVPSQLFATNKENQLLMMNNNVFNQKRNSMNEADRRRQLRKGPPPESQQRPVRSANASPSTAHQYIVNQLGQVNYSQLSNAEKLAVGNLLTQSQQRPGTSGGVHARTQKSSPNTSKGAIRPKTTAKAEPYS